MRLLKTKMSRKQRRFQVDVDGSKLTDLLQYFFGNNIVIALWKPTGRAIVERSFMEGRTRSMSQFFILKKHMVGTTAHMKQEVRDS